MAYLSSCECSWNARDHKTFYVRETEKVDGKTKAKWIPIGVVCLGCQKTNFKQGVAR